MTKRAPKLIASAFLLVTLATACGGDDGRPSQDEIADAMKDSSGVFGEDLSDDTIDIDCIAKIYAESDLSDEALRAMVDNDTDYDLSSDDRDAFTEASGQMMECMDVPDMPDLEDLETPTS